MALTIPATEKKEAITKEWEENKYAQWIEGKPVVWPPRPEKTTREVYDRNTRRSVLELKRAVKLSGGEVIQADTLQSLTATLKKILDKRPAAALSVTLVVHHQKNESLVFFGHEIVRLSDALGQLAAQLRGYQVTFHALSCGAASAEIATPFQDFADLALLTAPMKDIEVGHACHLQKLIIAYRAKGLRLLDAIEAARLEIMRDLRKNPPKQPFLMELPRSRVVRPIQVTTPAA